MGATQAAVVDEGPAAPAATVIGTGPNTTGLYTTQNARGNAATAGGLNYQWLMQGASFAQYELQAASGGAVVLYSMYLNTVTEHPGNVSGPAIPLPAGFGPLVTTATKTGVPRRWMRTGPTNSPPWTRRRAPTTPRWRSSAAPAPPPTGTLTSPARPGLSLPGAGSWW